MVSKNNRTKKMEAVADRQPHFGIRKLTIGAASVLLGTTLWMGTTASTSHADAVDDGDNGVESHQESHTQANNGASSAKSVVVVKNDNSAANQSQASSISDDSGQTSSSSVASSQSAQSSTQSSTASKSGQTDASSKSSSVDTSSLETNKAKGAAVVAQNKANKVANSSSAAQKQGAQTSQKAQSNAATNKAATSSSSNAISANKAAETLARDAAANTAKQVINNSAVSSTESSITTAGNTGKTNQSGNNVLSFNLDKAALKGLTLTGSQNLNKLFGVSLAASPASGNAGNTNSQGEGSSSETNADATVKALTDTTGFNKVSDWSTLQNAANDSSVKGVIVNGNITADGDLTINHDFIIAGAKNDGSVALNLGTHAVTNNSKLTLQNITVNGSILGQGTVNVEGTVTSNVDDSNKAQFTGNSVANVRSQLQAETGTADYGIGDIRYDNSRKTWYANNWTHSNIVADQVNIATGATLNVNRSITGDGIVLEGGASHFVDNGTTFGITQATNNNGTLKVGINGKLNINLKDAETANRANEKGSSLDNASAGIRAIDNGHFITEDSAQVTINAGHGRAIDFGEPFGGTSSVEIPSNPLNDWYNNRWVSRNSSYARNSNNTVILGDSTKMNIAGRDGILMGNRSNFVTGNHSIVHIDSKGNGAGLLGDAFSSVEVSPQSQLLLTSDGKDDSGHWSGGNFIGLGENGQFRVEHDATFRYRLTNRRGSNTNSSNFYDDNMNIISPNQAARPLVYVGPDATFDGQSDYADYYGEIFAFPFPDGNNGTFQIDGAKYVNWEKNAVEDDSGHGNLYYGPKSLIDAENGKGNTYFVFKWNSKNLNDHNYTFDDSSADSIKQSIQNFENSSDEYWRNVKHLATQYSAGLSPQDERHGHLPDKGDINGDATPGQKHGYLLNKVKGEGFNPEDSQRLILVATTIPTQVDQTSQDRQKYGVQIVYDENLKPGQIELVQKGQYGLERTTTTHYYNVDASSGKRTLDTTKGKNGTSTTTTVLQKAQDEIIHVGPQTATINYINRAIDSKTGAVSYHPVADGNNPIVGYVTGNPILADDIDSKGNIQFDANGNVQAANINYTDYDSDLRRATQIENFRLSDNQSVGNDSTYGKELSWLNTPVHKYDVTGLTKSAIQKAAEKLQEGQTAQLGSTKGPVYYVVLDQRDQNCETYGKLTINYYDENGNQIYPSNAHLRSDVYSHNGGNVGWSQTTSYDDTVITDTNDSRIGRLEESHGIWTYTYGYQDIPTIPGYTFKGLGENNTNGAQLKEINGKQTVGGAQVIAVDNGKFIEKDGLDAVINLVYTKDTYHKGQTESRDVVRTINYYDGTTGAQMPTSLVGDNPVIQTSTLSRTQIVDQNGNVIGYGTVSSDGSTYTKVTDNDGWTITNPNWNEVDSKDLSTEGYKAARFADGSLAPKVDAETVNTKTQNQTINIYYDHDTIPVTPDHPDRGLKESDLNRTVTRTIKYQDTTGKAVNGSPDGKSTYIQTAHFTRTAIVDKVTNKVLGYDTDGDGKVDVSTVAGDYAWAPVNNSNQFSAVNSKSPQEVGYNNVDIPVVQASTVTALSDPSTITVTYSKNAEQGAFQIHYIDEDDHDAVLHSDPISGHYDDPVHYDPASEIKTLTGQGYVQDNGYNKADKYVAQTTINKDNDGKIYVIAFKHGIKKGKQEVIVPTETIHFVYSDGTQAAPDVHGNAGNFEFTRTPTVDAVNGHVIDPGKWNAESYTFDDGTNNVKAISGYTANKTTYGNKTATPTNKDVEDTVIYTKNPTPPAKQQGTVIVGFYDDTTDTPISGVGYNSGKQDEGTAVTYNPATDQQKLINEGYVYVRTDGTLPTTVPVGNTVVTIHMKHGQQPVDPQHPGTPDTPNKPGQPQHPTDYKPSDLTKNVTRTIHYIIGGNAQDKPTAPKDVTQQVTFTQHGVYDTVTGKWITPLTWSADQTVNEVTSPTVDKYHVISVDRDGADTNVGAVTLTHANDSYTVNVTYEPDAVPPTQEKGSITVTFHDDTTDTDLQGYGNKTGEVNSGTAYTYNPQTDLNKLIAIGYKQVGTLPTIPSQVPNTDLSYVIHVIHGTQPVDPDHPGTPQTPNKPGTPQHPTDYKPSDLTKTITRTIHYSGAGAQTPKDVTQNVTFTQSGVYDTVTGKWITPLTWSGSQTVSNVSSPKINDYHVTSVDRDSTDNTNVDSKTLTHADDSYQVNVTYGPDTPVTPTKEQGSVTINVHDDTINQDLPDYGYKTGTVDEGTAVNYANHDDQIKELTNRGYVIVSDPYADGTVVKTVPGNDNLTYTIHVKHGRQPVNPENPGTPQTPNKPGQPQHPTDYRPEDLTKTVTRTIHYVGAGNQTPKDVAQQVTFTQSGVYDTVTGKWITPLHWSDDQMVANVASPTITGYHVVSVDKDSTDNKNVDAKTLSHTTSDYVVTVTYAPDAAPVVGKGTIEVTVHDVTTNHDLPQYGKSSGSQNVGTDFTYDKTGTITDLTNHGYKVLNPDVVIPTKITEGDHSTIIYVEHSFSPVNPNHPHNGIDPKNYTDTTTETVTYRALDRNGNVDSTVKVPANNNQTVTWTRTLTIDNVTGQLVSNGQYDTGWTSTDPDFKAVTTPVLDGYYADRASVPSALSHHGDQPVTVVVTYRPNGRIIPVDQNGKQISGTDTPEFPTNPKNPTETTTGRIPYVPDNYKPVNPGQTPGSPISPDPTNPGKDVEVPFKPQTPTPVAKDQNAVVNYIDLDNNNQQVATSGALSGKAGARIDYSTATTLTRLEGEGYVLVNNGFDPNSEIQYYDNNDNTTQTYVVTLKHGHQTVTPDNPGNPGTPNVPGQPQHPTDYTPESLTKTVTRTIHYTGASGQTPQDVKQEVTFTRSGVYDTVTGKWITPLHWSDSQSVANVTSPTINGYHIVSVDKDSTDHQNVDSKILTHADSDYVVTVTYAKNAAPVVGKGTITVTVHDVTTGQDLPQYGKISGSENVGSDFSYDKTGTITTLTNLGYKVLNPDIVIPTKITEGNHQSIIYVEHTTTTVTPDKPGHPGEPINPDNPNGPKYPQGTDESQVKRTGTQTIHYTGAGANTPSDNKQSFDFTRTITFDNVTGKITSTTPWNVSSHTFGDVDTPVVNGYHADKRTAGGTTITPDDLTKTVTVTYSPNGKIIPVDPSGKPIPNVPQPQYPTNPNDPTGVTPDEPVPNIPGMTPSTPTVTPANPGKDTKVPYTPIAEQKATIHYIDSDNDNKDIITPVTETGKSGSSINYSTKDTIKQLTDEGYVLVTNGFDPNDVAPDFDSDSKKDQGFEVIFKHGTQTINPNNPGTPGQPINPNDPNGPKWPDDSDAKHLQVEGKQTVHYVGVDPSDPNAPKDVENDVYFNHEVVIDKVTGKVIDDHGWTVSTDKAGQHLVNHGDGHEFDAIKTPVVNGYVADKRDAGQGFVTHDNPVINDTVTYKKVGKIVPVDPNGNPIPNAPTPSYHNDPTDPTRVVPDEPVPKIDGYTPNVNTVTPQDPTKDTPVIYTKPKPVTPPTPDNPTPNPPTPDNPQPNNPEPNNPQPNNPQPNNPAPAPVHGETVPGTTPTEPQPNNNQTETTKPHGENVPTKSEKSAQPKGRAILDNPIKPKGQTVPTIKNAVPTQGQTNATKTATGQAQNTLPQTGNNQQANATAAAIGGAAAALGLIGLAGVRKKRRKGEKGDN